MKLTEEKRYWNNCLLKIQNFFRNRAILEQHSRDQAMQLVIVFCNSYMHDDYITVMRMSSAYRWDGKGGMGLDSWPTRRIVKWAVQS